MWQKRLIGFVLCGTVLAYGGLFIAISEWQDKCVIECGKIEIVETNWDFGSTIYLADKETENIAVTSPFAELFLVSRFRLNNVVMVQIGQEEANRRIICFLRISAEDVIVIGKVGKFLFPLAYEGETRSIVEKAEQMLIDVRERFSIGEYEEQIFGFSEVHRVLDENIRAAFGHASHEGNHRLPDCAILSVKAFSDIAGAVFDSSHANGTGFVVAPGYVLTAFHVVDLPESTRNVFVFIDGWKKAQVLRTTKMNYERIVSKDSNGILVSKGLFRVIERVVYESDIVLLGVETGGLPCLPLASELPQKGDSLSWWWLGAGRKFRGTFDSIRDGMISERWLFFWMRFVNEMRGEVIQISGEAILGSSGSPIVNAFGEVVGMVVRKKQDFIYGVAVSELRKFLSLCHIVDPR